ncbi:unnamed protein product, partial [Hapterophycus canaliculatus]
SDTDTNRSAVEAAGSSSSTRARHQQHQQRELLVPRGLDLLPSMRAPRRLPRSASSTINGGGGVGTATGGGRKTAGTVEYIPCVGGIASLGGATAGRADAAASPGPAVDDLKERVQWFPRGLPKESTPTPAGGGQDERESALLNTRASMAIDRLGEQVQETRKRQGELEVKRRQKVGGEAIRLVRGAAEHEKLRQKHFRRMKQLRVQLESLEGTKDPSSPRSAFGHARTSSADGEALDEGEKEEQGELGGGGAMSRDDEEDDDDEVHDDHDDNDDDSDGDSDVPVSSANGGSPAGVGKPNEAGEGEEVGSPESKTAPGSPSSPTPSPTPTASALASCSSRGLSPRSAEPGDEVEVVAAGVNGSAAAAPAPAGMADKPEGRGESENGDAMQGTGGEG